MSTFLRVSLLLACLLPACGCARKQASPAAPNVQGREVVRGQTAITVLTNKEGVKGQSAITILTGITPASNNEEVIPPKPVGALQTPEYPVNPLKSRYGDAVVAVRVFLDDQGRVTDIKDAPACPSTGGRFAPDFRSAVEEAIHRWKFQPAEYHRFAEGKDLNGDGKPDYVVVTETKSIPVYFDVRFDFSIVKGRGRVR